MRTLVSMVGGPADRPLMPISANRRRAGERCDDVDMAAPSSQRTVTLRRIVRGVWVLAFVLGMIGLLVGQPAWFKWGVQAPVGSAALLTAGIWFASRYRDIKAFEIAGLKRADSSSAGSPRL
jgi:hypothetical protein